MIKQHFKKYWKLYLFLLVITICLIPVVWKYIPHGDYNLFSGWRWQK